MKRVKLHYSAFQAYRRNEGARAALSEAQKIAARANSMAAPTHAGQPSYTAEGPRANEKGATVLVHTDNPRRRASITPCATRSSRRWEAADERGEAGHGLAQRGTRTQGLSRELRGSRRIQRHEPYPVRHRGTHGRFGRPVRVETIDRCAVWAASRWEASDVAQRLVLPRLKRIVELPEVADWDITGLTDFPMPDGRPRYQILIQLTVKTDE